MAGVLLICALALSHLVWCSESKPASSSCDWRYYQHYKSKGCVPVIGQDGCPVRFDCKPMSLEERQVCHYKGRKYQFKEKIEDTRPCEQCQCSEEDPTSDAFISCAVVDCPDWVPQNKSCYMGHSPDACCPTEICPSNDPGAHTRCDYNGVSYKLGEYVETGNQCRSCICTKDWSGIEGPGCWDIDCLTDQYAREIRDGCLPVYHEKTCCPIDINCGQVYGSTPVTSVVNKENLCFHKGKYYEIGSRVHLEGDKYGCTQCKCRVPPDFTCVQKACPTKPRPNCQMVFGHCCPEFKCP